MTGGILAADCDKVYKYCRYNKLYACNCTSGTVLTHLHNPNVVDVYKSSNAVTAQGEKNETMGEESCRAIVTDSTGNNQADG